MITDTLGRVVNFHYDASNCLTAITAPDFNTGTTRPLVRLQYRDVTLSYNYSSNPVPKVRQSTFKMIKAIYYPATATGYWFGETDSYSTYGMLLKVSEQRGMTFDNAPLTSQGVITAGTMSREMTYVYNSPATNEPIYTEMREKWASMDTSAPGIDTATGSAKTTYQVTEEPTLLRRSTRITRPDGTIQVQWARLQPGAFDDGLVFFDKTCASGTPCAYDDGGLRASTTNWEPGYRSAPRPNAIFVLPRPWQGTAFIAGTYVKTCFLYGTWNNQVTRADEYGYASSILRSTVTQYELNSYYLDRHIYSLPKIVEVSDSAGVKQKTEFVYDYNSGLSNTPNVVQHDATYDPQDPLWDSLTDFRGLVTQVKRYPTIGSSVGMVTETRTYDETGNLLTAATSCCEQMSYTYTNNTCYAYPETQKRGSASDPNTQVTTSAVYNTNTGLVTQTTDANGRVSTTDYYLSSGGAVGTLRPKNEWSPTGAKTHYDYNDTALTVNVRTYEAGGAILGAGSDRTLDGAGRVCSEVAFGAGMAQDKVETKYDGLGRVWQQTRPYRPGVDTAQWYVNVYDALGRLKEVSTTINSQVEKLVQKFYDDDAPVPSVADANVRGNTILTKDAWGRERWARFDWADRLCEVVEPKRAAQVRWRRTAG